MIFPWFLGVCLALSICFPCCCDFSGHRPGWLLTMEKGGCNQGAQLSYSCAHSLGIRGQVCSSLQVCQCVLRPGGVRKKCPPTYPHNLFSNPPPPSTHSQKRTLQLSMFSPSCAISLVKTCGPINKEKQRRCTGTFQWVGARGKELREMKNLAHYKVN